MVQVRITYSRLYKKLSVLIISISIWNKSACSTTIFSSETFNNCGFFVADFQSTSNEQGDVIHEIIEQLQFSQRISRSLIIKNKLAQKDIHPTIFRSMKYDCFLYVQINFGKDFFSTIPSFKNPLEIALYQKALFLIIVNSPPQSSFTVKSWFLHFERQYRIFIVRIYLTLGNKHRKRKLFISHEKYFFCAFCKLCLQRINSKNTNFLFLTLSSFQKSWLRYLSEHYYQLYSRDNLANRNFCRQKNFMYLYEKHIECLLSCYFN